MEKTLTLLDGGMGRELEKMGAPFSQPLWSAEALIEAPEYVHKAHRRFIEAGAEIITVNSYACVPFHLGDELYQQQGAKLAQQAAEIARTEADRHKKHKVQVAGSIPPPCGSYRPDLFDKSSAEAIVKTLVDAQSPYVDLWIVETIASIQELEVVHAIMSRSKQDVYYAFTLDDEKQDTAVLRSGETVQQAVTTLLQLGAEGIFFNCSVPEVMALAIKETHNLIINSNHNVSRSNNKIEIGVYANNFAPIKADHQANNGLTAMRELSANDYLTYAKEWQQLGATIIGGCCGIGPEHIQQLNNHFQLY